MAPSKDAEKPRDRIDMIADISKTGKLVEMGCDPFTRAPENKAVATQTEGTGVRGSTPHESGSMQAHRALEVILASKEVVRTTDSPASQVLRLVVGLLGMEVHEKPSSWAESWLTFQDKTLSSLGLGSKKSPRKETDLGQEKPVEWQMRVIEHLRQRVDSRTQLITIEASEKDASKGGHDWGPDFPEHLNLAEFALRRITYAVGVLEDPEKHDRPILLREYTEEMVLKVAKDLRQWLHQLGSLLGLYHVHLLDLEDERSKLAKQLAEQEAKFAVGEEDRRAAMRRHDQMAESWQEEKMKRDAERLLGIKMAGEDAKIYSQRDVDEMFKKWEQENLDPLIQENKELRLAREALQEKLRQPRKDRTDHANDHDDEDPPMGKADLAKLISIIDAVNDRVHDEPMNRLLTRLSTDLQDGGKNLAEILMAVHALSPGDRPGSKGGAGSFGGVDDGDAIIRMLDAMASEFNSLEAEARACPVQNGADKLIAFAAWARDGAKMVKGVVDGGNENGRFVAPPRWDLGSLSMNNDGLRPASEHGKPDSSHSGGAGEAEAARQAMEKEFELKIRALRRELEAKIREALERAERERINAQEALERLAEESAKADATLTELRRKIKMLEALLREKGLGKQAGDAIWGAGLSEFMQGRDVFERLYRDALDRMRRLAESQARFFEESSEDFLRSIGSIMDTNLKLPGLYQTANGQEDIGSIFIPRSSGGARPSGTPARSHSPPGSPTRASPRPVQSAPSRLNDPLSVARLLTPAALAATPIAMRASANRTENAGRIQPVASAHGLSRPKPPQGRENPELGFLGSGFSFGSASTTSGGPSGAPSRPQTQQNISQLASKTRQQSGAYPALRSVGGLGPGEGRLLPPLEGKGQGRAEGSRSPSNDDKEARVSNLRGVRMGSPVREARGDRERMERALFQTGRDVLRQASAPQGKDPLLTIGSLRPSGAPPPPSGLLPPQGIAAANRGAARPATHSGAGRMVAKQGGAHSMPQIGPPRLLVQSVGAAY